MARRNRSYTEIVAQSGTARAKELHDSKQARLDKKKAKLLAEIETVEADKLADKADFEANVPQDLLKPVMEAETTEEMEVETSENSEENQVSDEVFENIGAE